MEERCCILSIFGATGDLTSRKLLPALYYLEQEKQIDENFRAICIARKEKSNEQYRREVSDSIRKFSRVKVNEEVLGRLIPKIHYHRLEFSSPEDYVNLKKTIENVSGEKCRRCERIFYLAVPPSFFGVIANNLKRFGLAEKNGGDKAYNRVVFEKPFGHSLDSAKGLNRSITGAFDEKQIYRIDHYTAKELVQNLLVLRFANSIFEPLWNREYIDHIQITVAETLGVENRAGYYENAGALRDIMQNHMMQLLALIAMEEPKSLDVQEIRNQKVRVLKSIKKIRKSDAGRISVKGQYIQGIVDGKKAVSFREEHGISKNSMTETYFALKLEINNKMWRGVPFYLRTGKRLKDRATEIIVIYKDVPFGLFSKINPEKNMMIIRVQPYEGITLQFNSKIPGNKILIDNVEMDFCHECKFGSNSPEAYERLLYDVMIGDQTLFTGWGEVGNSWKIIDALIEAHKQLKLFDYEAGSWGPAEADKLIEKDGRKWVEPKKPAYAELLNK